MVKRLKDSKKFIDAGLKPSARCVNETKETYMTQLYKELYLNQKLCNRNEWETAIERLQKTAETLRQTGNWTAYITHCCAISECLLETSSFEEAHQLMLQTYHLYQEHPSGNPPVLAEVLDVLGQTYANYLGNYQKSLDLHLKALECCEKHYGHAHERTADAHLSLAGSYGNLIVDEKQWEHSQKALQIYEKVHGGSHPLAGNCYFNMAICKWGGTDNEVSISFLKQADAIHRAWFGDLHGTIAQNRFFETNVYVTQKNAKASLSCCKAAIATNSRLFGLYNAFNQRAYAYLGAINNSFGNVDDALLCFGKARDIGNKVFAPNHIYVGDCHYYYGKCLRDSGKIADGMAQLKLAETIYAQSYGANASKNGDVQRELAIAYERTAQYEQAIECYKKAIESIEKSEDASGFQLAFTQLTLGRCFSKVKEHIKAEERYLLGYRFLKKYKEQRPSLYHFSLICLGRCYFAKGEYRIGLDYVEEAIDNFSTKNGSYIDLISSLSQKILLSAALFEQTGKAEHLYHALNTYLRASQLIEKNKTGTNGQRAMKQLLKSAKSTYEAAINVIHKLLENGLLPPSISCRADLLNMAFECMEQSKALLLYSTLKDAELKIVAQVPPQIIAEIDELEKKVRHAERQLELARHQQVGEERLNKLEKEYFSFFEQLRNLLKQLEKTHPDYHQIKYAGKSVLPSELRNHLKINLPHTAILSYVIGAETRRIYIFYVSDTACHLLARPMPDGFEDCLDDYLQSINAFGKKKYLQSAHELYRLLVEPIMAFAQKDGLNHLLLLPDEELHFVPFEALLTAPVDPKTAYPDLPYLLMDFDVSYHYSGSLLYYLSQKRATQHTPNDFVGFAPVYAQNNMEKETEKEYNELTTRSVRIGDKEYKELLYSEREVSDIERLFKKNNEKAKVFLHENASKRNFEKAVSDKKYVLVAAHGLHNAQNPNLSGIIFSPDVENINPSGGGDANAVLYFSDAYDLKLKADLVVLSSCKSGIGKLEKGEGVMNMNRGLLHAGANNIIYTLFKVYDKASCELSVELFRGILAGKSYRTALTEAKRKLIGSRKTMPKFWAGYVLLGQ